MIWKILTRIKNCIVEVYNIPRLIKRTADNLKEERRRSVDPQRFLIYVISPEIKDGRALLDLYAKIPEDNRDIIVWAFTREHYYKIKQFKDAKLSFMWHPGWGDWRMATVLNRPYMIIGELETD